MPSVPARVDEVRLVNPDERQAHVVGSRRPTQFGYW